MNLAYSLELLEQRRLLAGPAATFADGILQIHGTDGADDLRVSLDSTTSELVATAGDGTHGIPVEADLTGTTTSALLLARVPLAEVQRIVVFASSGDDNIRIFVDIQSVIHGAAGNDTIQTAGGDDRIWGGHGDDVIHAGAGDDYVYGRDGSDRIWGEDGNDLLYGNGKNDTIYGNTGHDTIIGGAGSDELRGGLGDDIFNTGELVELIPLDGSPAVLGWPIPKWFIPTMFHDSIFGGQGNDQIFACSGDTSTGGPGQDAFCCVTPEPPSLPDFDDQEDTLHPSDVPDIPLT